LNPSTPLDQVREVLPDLDLLLIMTVNPGFGGQSYIPSMTDKVRRARAMLDEAGSGAWLQVDGGISPATIGTAWQAGARSFVAGNAIFASTAPGAQIGLLRQQCVVPA
jgi:ribulose-phosphate 3-epimerase